MSEYSGHILNQSSMNSINISNKFIKYLIVCDESEMYAHTKKPFCIWPFTIFGAYVFYKYIENEAPNHDYA